MPPSGVVAGLRRDFTCNVSKNEKPYCAAQCRSYPKCKKQAAPARRAEARPTSAKRELFPSPVYGERCPKGGRGDEVAKRRKRWICQAASLLGFTAASLAFETLQATSLHFSFCHSAAVLFQKPPSGVDTGLAKRELFPSPVYGGRCPKGGRGIKSSSGVVAGFYRFLSCF